MGYEDKTFWEKYWDYLHEPVVRRNHDQAFKMFAEKANLPEQLRVVDLGCGLMEYGWFDRHHFGYAGVDVKKSATAPYTFIEADYATMDYSQLPFEPNAFVSLFSIECCNPPDKKYMIYRRLFEQIPNLKFGLAGGFFYESKRDQPTVTEVGGLVSHQTIEDPKFYGSILFSEHRFVMRTPSKMFGNDVVEVWKFFARK